MAFINDVFSREMRILIPYDGTKNAENALLELKNVEFRQDDEILIVITDVFLPESAEEFLKAKKERLLNLEKSGTCSYSPARRRLEEERFLAREIRHCLLSFFPAQNIQIKTLPGLSLVSSEVLGKAARWQADLIILGSLEGGLDATKNGYKSGLWRVALEAECSVRLACNASRVKSAVKSNCIFIEDKESLGGKQISERLKNSDDIAGILMRQVTCSDEVIRLTQKSEQIPKIMLHHRCKPPTEIRNVAVQVSASG